MLAPMRTLSALLVVVGLTSVGCGGADALPSTPAGGARDAGGNDAQALEDAGTASDAARPVDAGAPDAGVVVDCALAPACDAASPTTDPLETWRHTVAAPITVAAGAARHRGRDLYLRESDPQWALAKFSYGAVDSDLQDEDVDVWLLRGCTTWELLGRATTTNEGAHATVEGVADGGGRVYFPIPDAARLGIGRHRIHFVVRGDHTTADQFIEVLPSTARFVVTDMDGTLTTSESAAFTSLFSATPPDANAGAAAALTALARRGYRIFYLTARPEWLETKSHEWIVLRGFPPGNVHTTLNGIGALGPVAETFKTDELASLEARFPGAVEWGIGNTSTDAAAYAASGIAPDHSLFYMFDPGATGTRFDDYAALVAGFDALTSDCR